MPARVGVDVGGTFTKAVACDSGTGVVVARAVVPTSHAAPLGVAEGVIDALERVAVEVERLGSGPITVVAHSTTQAVNALLEGDTATVGVLGIGRRPDVRRARKRTRVGDVRIAPGRRLRVVNGFLDSSDGLPPELVRASVRRLTEHGAEVICVSEAFGVEDPAGERAALDAAAATGVPACAGHELTGQYGLELRTLTAALNASILPIALRTAELVGGAAARHAHGAPLLVMRGDGGAADAGTMRLRPLLTAFSGPAASVAGALRHLHVRDGVVVEIGGTSSNVSAISGGRPVLSYVRVLDHVTSVRSLDVRVAGVAGGSMLRVGRRFGKDRVSGVGPRSAHIAGLPYVTFSDVGDVVASKAVLASPRPGDPAEYVVLEHPNGSRFALTVTCAANALGSVPEGSHARGNPDAARLGFQALARLVGRDWEELALEALSAAAGALAPVVAAAASENALSSPALVGVGGGAGALIPPLAEALGMPWSIPPDAEVISSIGDARSLIRVEVERGIARPTPEIIFSVVEEAEAAAIAAGAAPASVEVETETIPERRALRAVAVGAAALDSDAGGEVDDETLATAARKTVGSDARLVARSRAFTVFAAAPGRRSKYVVLDRRGTVSLTGEGTVLVGNGSEVADLLPGTHASLVRHLGPVSVAPAVRLVRGARLIDLSLLSSPEGSLEAAVAECMLAEREPVVAIFSRT